MERRDAERSLNVQVAQLVRDAEQCGLCVVPQTESQRTRMVQMVRKGALERVFPGMFVSSATAASWKLNPRLRAWTLAKTYAHLHPAPFRLRLFTGFGFHIRSWTRCMSSLPKTKRPIARLGFSTGESSH